MIDFVRAKRGGPGIAGRAVHDELGDGQDKMSAGHRRGMVKHRAAVIVVRAAVCVAGGIVRARHALGMGDDLPMLEGVDGMRHGQQCQTGEQEGSETA